jgi:hypothetical protein
LPKNCCPSTRTRGWAVSGPALIDGRSFPLVSTASVLWSGRGLGLPEDLVDLGEMGSATPSPGRQISGLEGEVPSRRPPRGLPCCAAEASPASSVAVRGQVAPTSRPVGQGQADGIGTGSPVAREGPATPPFVSGSSGLHERRIRRPSADCVHAAPAVFSRERRRQLDPRFVPVQRLTP